MRKIVKCLSNKLFHWYNFNIKYIRDEYAYMDIFLDMSFIFIFIVLYSFSFDPTSIFY